MNGSTRCLTELPKVSSISPGKIQSKTSQLVFKAGLTFTSMSQSCYKSIHNNNNLTNNRYTTVTVHDGLNLA